MDESLTLFDMKKIAVCLAFSCLYRSDSLLELRGDQFESKELSHLQQRNLFACSQQSFANDCHDWEKMSALYIDQTTKCQNQNTKGSCSLWGIPNFPDSGFVMKIEWRFITLNFAFKNLFAARNSALSYPCTFMSSISAVLLQRMSVCKAKNVSPASYKILPWKADCTESY